MMHSGAAMRVVVGTAALAVLTYLIPSALAQDQGESGWEVIETCTEGLTYPVLPRSQWDFEGVIFSENRDGVRAIRTDVNTSYFVALDSAETFSSVGAFSPDGKWFAYPVGWTKYYVNEFDDTYFEIEAIQVVSTDPARNIRRFEWHDYGVGLQSRYALAHIYWVDDERLFYPSEYVYNHDEFEVLNITSGQTEPWTSDDLSHGLFNLSPDATRGFVFTGILFDELGLVTLSTGEVIASFPAELLRGLAWRHDSAAFYTVRQDTEASPEYQLVAISREGEPPEVLYSSSIEPAYYLSVSPQDNFLAFFTQDRLFIVDLVNRQIRDLCFTFDDQYRYDPIVWSPDGRQLAFTYDSYPVLLSLDTLEMEVLDYPTGRLLGWYPVE